jgi:hypothetical protein
MLGLCLGLADWSTELKILLAHEEKPQELDPAARMKSDED